MKSTYKYFQNYLPTSFNHVIVQNNYHSMKDVSGFVYKPTGEKESDEQQWANLVNGHTIALFRFKPKATAIDLGELA